MLRVRSSGRRCDVCERGRCAPPGHRLTPLWGAALICRMTATPLDLLDLLDLLDRSLGGVGVLIDKIRSDPWSAATPCDAWAVRDVVTHLAGMNRVFAAMLTDSPLPEREPISHDVLPSAYRSSSDGLLRVFAQAGVLERSESGLRLTA